MLGPVAVPESALKLVPVKLMVLPPALEEIPVPFPEIMQLPNRTVALAPSARGPNPFEDATHLSRFRVDPSEVDTAIKPAPLFPEAVVFLAVTVAVTPRLSSTRRPAEL